ncbi:MAG: carboxypeptidase regulatory-like domain-containing protein [Thermoanaerobaculia bacterium]
MAQAAITGITMTEEGEALSGATVTAFKLELTRDSLMRWMSTEPARVALASAKSDSKGKFTLDVETAGVVEIVIEAPGFVPLERRAAGDMELGAIPMQQGEPFRTIVTGGGKPLAGATVVTGAGIVLVTGEDGAFTLTVRDGTAPRVRIYHPEVAPLDVASGKVSRIARLQLSPGVSLTGRTVDSKGQPVAGAELTVDGIPLGRSADDGSFSIERVSPAWKEITAVEGVRVATASRLATRREYALRLAPGATISGTVRNTISGANVPGVAVAVSPSEGIRLDPPEAVTDAKGAFTIGPIAPGRYRLLVRSPTLAFSESPIALSGGDRINRVLPVEPLAIIRGTVTDQNRRPVAAARIAPTDPSRDAMAMGMRMRLSAPAWSGPDGTFVFRGTADGEIALGAKRRGLPSGRSEPVAAEPGATRSGVRIVIPRGIEVAGVVTDPAGDPLRGASVRFATAAGPRQQFVIRRMAGPSAIDPEVLYTDAEGRFSASLESGKYDLVVQREGYAPERIAAIPVEPGIEPLSIRLTEGASITGRVVRPNGSGVQDVNINVMNDLRLWTDPTVTGPDGGFTLSDLPPGPATVMASNMGSNIREIRMTEAPEGNLVIEIPAGGTVRGRVVEKSTGRPVTNFEVGPSGERRGSGMVMMGPPNLTRFQSDDGTFEIDNIPEGSIELLVQASGYVSGKMPGIEVKPGGVTDDIEIPLETGTRITGRVLGPDGSAVARAAISTVEGSSPMPMARRNNAVMSDGDGNYILEGIPEGEMELRAAHQSYVTETRSVKVAGREMQVDFRLGRGAEVQGSVVTANGAPVAGADVFARSAVADSGGESAKTDANGMFRMSGLAEGRYLFRASKSGMVPGSVEDVVVGSGIPIRIELGDGGTITGRVLGLPPSEMSVVQVVASSGSSRAQSGVSPDGSFTIDGVAPGSTRVWAEGVALMARRTSAEKVVEVASGSRVAVDLEFGTGHSVRGRVSRQGAPVDGVSVSFTPRDRALPSGSTRSEGSGHYEVTGLQDGDYQVRAFDLRTMASWSGDHRVSGSGTLDIDIGGSRIEGRVFHASTSEPIGDSVVTLQPSNAEQRFATMPVRSDAAGRFVLDNVTPGDYRLRVEKSGFGQEVRDLRVSDAPIADLEFRLSPTDGIALRIVDARDGRALNSFISVVDGAGRPVHQGSFRPDSSGTTRLSLAPGSYSAVVNASGYASERIQFSVPGSALAVALRPGGSIRIDSSAASSVRARLLDQTGQPRQSGMWDPRGEMMLRPGSTSIENVAPGIYTLEILDAAGAVTNRKQVNVVEGQLSVVSI